MRSRLRFWKYPISILLLLLVVAVFTIFFTTSEKAAAPFEAESAHDINATQSPDESDTPEEPEPDETEAGIEEAKPNEDQMDKSPNPTEDGFITYILDEADIHTGYLLLVNHDHSFSILDDFGLVSLNEEKTSNFRVQPASIRVHSSIVEPLDEMMDAYMAASNSRTVAVRSGFRNFTAQQSILNDYASRMGRREALRWVSRPGHSEHHTGLAVDFGVFSGGIMNQFEGTGATAWFRRNAHNYGFILRYPRNKEAITQTAFEPWHFRYVGFPHAIIMRDNDWSLEEYIELLREYTFDEPMLQEVDEVLYEIYFVEGTSIPLPFHSEFEISGNNIDGFIVTIVRQPFDPDVVIDTAI